MPLRSVEAATRDDAIAAAREQFGPSARVVGVRRVRSGGVLGFFATERYIAEVANDTSGRPAVPSPASGRAVTAEDDDDYDVPSPGYTSSPLSAAAPATAAPSSATEGRARPAAPPRNGAAAWAAAAGTPGPAASPSRASSPWSAAPSADDDRVDELAGLLGGDAAPSAPAAPVYGRSPAPRPSTPRTSGFPTPAPSAFPSVSPISFPVASSTAEHDDDPFVEDFVPGRPVLRADDSPAVPSPFTAALARMVSGDRDVREAVEHALEKPAIKRARSDAEPRSAWPGPLRFDDTSAPSSQARQEEETVGDQVIAPPTPLAPETAELPNWAVEPEVPAGGSSREEAIAEVLRSALAQGHSDEALAGILRKVLAGEPPVSALSEPVNPEAAAPVSMSLAMALGGTSVPVVEVPELLADEPAVEAPVTETYDSAVPEAAVEETEIVEEVAEVVAEQTLPDAPIAQLFETPAAELPSSELVASDVAEQEAEAEQPEVFEAAVAETPRYTAPSYVTPSYTAPTFELPPAFSSYVPSTSIWGTASDSIWGGSGIDSIWGSTGSEIPLWGETGSKRTTPVSTSDVPIWDDVAQEEQDTADEALPVYDAVMIPAAEDAPATDLIDVVEVEEPAETELFEDAVIAEDAVIVEDAVESDVVVEASSVDEDEVALVAPLLMRTASDPAPMSLDSTTVMPPLSLLPPLPGTRGARSGRPPVPPSSPRPQMPAATPSATSGSGTTVASSIETSSDENATSPLATVTRLHVAPPAEAPEVPETTEAEEVAELPDMFAEIPVDEPAAVDEVEDVTAETVTAEDVAPQDIAAEDAVTEEITLEDVAVEDAAREIANGEPGTVAGQLERLGVPAQLLGSGFTADVATLGTYGALTRALGLGLPKAPELPTGAGEVLFVVGPGVETLRGARALAGSLRLDPDRVLWATRGDLAALAPKSSRVSTIDAAIDRQGDVASAGSVTIVAVDAPLRADTYWMAQMLAIWSPVAVWAVVEATRKPEDLGPWIAALPRVDALMVQDTDLSADPAAVLRRVATPVAYLDGVRATPHRWASLLCERLEGAQA